MKTSKTPFTSLWAQGLSLGLTAITATALVGCGSGKTNPVEQYSDLQTVPKYDGPKARIQSYKDSALLNINVNGGKNLNFVEGQESTYLIQPISRIKGTAFKLVANNLPAGAQLVAVGDGTYKLTWLPAVGTLAPQEQNRDFSAEIAIEVQATNDPAADQQLRDIAVPRDIEMRLSKTGDQPTVEKCELVAGVSCAKGGFEITEGDSIAFSLIVKDHGSYEGYSPRLALQDDNSVNKEIPRVAASRMVILNKGPEVLGQGAFRFSGRLDTRGIEFPANAKSVVARFVAFVVSPSGLMSADETIEVKVNKKAEVIPPKPAPVAKPVAQPAPISQTASGAIASPVGNSASGTIAATVGDSASGAVAASQKSEASTQKPKASKAKSSKSAQKSNQKNNKKSNKKSKKSVSSGGQS